MVIFYGIAFVVFAFVCVMAALLVFRRIAGRARVRASTNLTDEAAQALGKVRPGKSFVRAEMASGDPTNPEAAIGRGGLALFSDELVFVKDGKSWKLALADITDMVRIRAASAFDDAEAAVDAMPDYLLKLSWKGGAASFAVLDVDEWIAAIAGAKP
jgi:hypothetical protein